MIKYTPKYWFTFIVRFRKVDTFRELLPMIGAVCVFPGFVAYMEINYFNLIEESPFKNIPVQYSLQSKIATE